MFKLVSSNEEKLKEFKRLGLEELKIEKGLDLPEVDADGETVIIYKSLAAGPQHIVEDTALHIEGESVGVNVRWLINSIANYNGKKAKWEVLLGVHNGDDIAIYRGVISGMITAKYCAENNGFGFDNYFIPDGERRTLHELELAGKKDEFSARKEAIKAFLSNEVSKVVEVENIPSWNGPMQRS